MRATQFVGERNRRRQSGKPRSEISSSLERFRRRRKGFDGHRRDWSHPWHGLQPRPRLCSGRLMTQSLLDLGQLGAEMIDVETPKILRWCTDPAAEVFALSGQGVRLEPRSAWQL